MYFGQFSLAIPFDPLDMGTMTNKLPSALCKLQLRPMHLLRGGKDFSFLGLNCEMCSNLYSIKSLPDFVLQVRY